MYQDSNKDIKYRMKFKFHFYMHIRITTCKSKIVRPQKFTCYNIIRSIQNKTALVMYKDMSRAIHAVFRLC